jgi:polar amino acid transport system substrate-binding protein
MNSASPKLRRRIAAGLAVAIAAAVSVASLNASRAAEPPGLLKTGYITFGTDFTFPPYENIVNNKQVGFDVDFGKLLARKLGLKPRFVDARFSALIISLQSRKFDAILSAIYITPERLKVVNFVPYFNTGNVIVVTTKGSFQPRKPLDFCGHVMSINSGAYVESVARGPLSKRCKNLGKAPITVKSFPTDTASFQEVAAGRADFTLGDVAVTKWRLANHPEYGLHISSARGKLYYPTPGGIAVRKRDPAIQTALQRAVTALEKNGKLPALRKKYGLAAPKA